MTLPWDADLFTKAPRFEDGRLIVPDEPGWGTQPEEGAIRAHPPRASGGLLNYRRP
jgi:L-alanine-DL-glutamate epimerase-like enolase superfamily enzyme